MFGISLPTVNAELAAATLLAAGSRRGYLGDLVAGRMEALGAPRAWAVAHRVGWPAVIASELATGALYLV